MFDFDFGFFIQNSVAGCISGFLIVLRAASFSSFVFQPTAVSSFIPLLFSAFLFSGILSQITYLFGSNLHGLVAGSSSTAVPFLAQMIVILLQSEQFAGATEQIINNKFVPTAMVIMIFCGLCAGLLIFIIGQLKFGKLLNYFPSTVIKGVFTACGFSMILGGLGMGSGNSLDLYVPSTWKKLGDNIAILQFFITLMFGISCKIVKSKSTKAWQFPAYVVCVLTLTYIILFGSGSSLIQARNSGWVFKSAEGSSSLNIWNSISFGDVEWGSWSGAILPTIGCILIAPLDLSLSFPALVDMYQTFDVNQELKIGGLSGVIAAIGGGTGVSYLALSPTRVGYESGATSRIASIASLFVNLFAFFWGNLIISALPRFYVGGLLFYAGLSYVLDGVYETYQLYSKPDYAVVWIMGFASLYWGLIIAVFAGLVLSSFIFIVQYSSSPFIRASTHSEFALEQEIEVIHLQGFLFFGSVETISNEVRRQLEISSSTRAFLFDMRLVFGVDSSSLESWIRLQKYLTSKNILLIFTSFAEYLHPVIFQQMESSGILKMVKIFASLPDAISWCNNTFSDPQKSKLTCMELYDEAHDVQLSCESDEEDSEVDKSVSLSASMYHNSFLSNVNIRSKSSDDMAVEIELGGFSLGKPGDNTATKTLKSNSNFNPQVARSKSESQFQLAISKDTQQPKVVPLNLINSYFFSLFRVVRLDNYRLNIDFSNEWLHCFKKIKYTYRYKAGEIILDQSGSWVNSNTTNEGTVLALMDILKNNLCFIESGIVDLYMQFGDFGLDSSHNSQSVSDPFCASLQSLDVKNIKIRFPSHLGILKRGSFMNTEILQTRSSTPDEILMHAGHRESLALSPVLLKQNRLVFCAKSSVSIKVISPVDLNSLEKAYPMYGFRLNKLIRRSEISLKELLLANMVINNDI